MPAQMTPAAIWSLRNEHAQAHLLPDIDPVDEQFTMAALSAAFPGTTVQYQPRVSSPPIPSVGWRRPLSPAPASRWGRGRYSAVFTLTGA
jgi:hypothetical protein